MIKEILTVPNELLLRKSKYVQDIFADDVQETIKDLVDTLKSSDKGAGLAAPQIGVLKRIFVAWLPEVDRIQVFINPEYMHTTESEVADWEGCLSIPNKIGIVKRHPSVIIDARDENGKKHHFLAEGFSARLFQHEIDHLDGILYTSKAVIVKDVEYTKEEIVHEQTN